MDRQTAGPWERRREAGLCEGQLPLARTLTGLPQTTPPPPEARGPRWPILGPALPQGMADEDRN